ncbi:MAG: hypothetical protein RRY79_07180 [Clostridia bacterium]
MRVWGKLKDGEGRVNESLILPIEAKKTIEIEDFAPIIYELCIKLDLARPVILNKHINEMKRFRRTVFKQADFIEDFYFETFEIEIIND